jgi:hypothetical protein
MARFVSPVALGLFEELLKDEPGFSLKDLTFDDIRLYVRDRLQEKFKMLRLAKSQLLQAPQSAIFKSTAMP